MARKTRNAAVRSSRRRMGPSELRREVDMQARTAGPGQRLRHVDTQCYDGEAKPETDAGRIFERIAEVIESVAVVEEGGHAEVARKIPDDLEGAGNEVLAAVPDGSDLLHAFTGPGNEDGTVLV